MGLTSPTSSSLLTPDEAEPMLPKTTLAKDLFIALHMIFVRINPLAPTKAPATIKTLLFITNPAAEAANPE